MDAYKHTVQYYETDRMGITHHSNYIRWMEEARTVFMKQIGWNLARLEEEGVYSPVIEASCKYKKTTTFEDEIYITIEVKEFKGVKLFFRYLMKNGKGDLVAEGESAHCFLNPERKPIRLKKAYPELYDALTELVG